MFWSVICRVIVMGETCNICGRTFKNEQGLNVHRTRKHPDHESVKRCYNCGRRYGGKLTVWPCPGCSKTNRPVIQAAIEADFLYYTSGHGVKAHLLPPTLPRSLCGQISVRKNLDGELHGNDVARFKGFAGHGKPSDKWCSWCRNIYEILRDAGAFKENAEGDDTGI